MLDEHLKLGIYNLSKSINVDDVIRSWILMGPSTFNKVSIISLESYDRSVYPPKLNNLINYSESHFIPYFDSDKLYFIDNELLAEILSNQEKDTPFSVDYSIMLDTNYASYIDDFIRNDWTNLNNEVFSVIDILIRENFHFDYIFYMIENFKNSFLNSHELNLSIVREKKTKLYQNLVSLERFKSIDREEYIKSGELKYNTSEIEAKLLADQIFNGIFYSSDAKEKMDYLLSVQRYMVLFIIGVMQIKFGTKTTVQRKIQKLFEYLNTVVGIYFDREMVIAYEYFEDQKNVKILSKINKGISSAKLLQIIENVAWDFSVPRIMERQLVLGGEGRYFVPFFLSNDFNLRGLLKLFKVKGVIYDISKDLFVPFSKNITREYFKARNCNIDNYFTDKAISERAEVHQYSKNNQTEIIKREFEKLVEVMKL